MTRETDSDKTESLHSEHLRKSEVLPKMEGVGFSVYSLSRLHSASV